MKRLNQIQNWYYNPWKKVSLTPIFINVYITRYIPTNDMKKKGRFTCIQLIKRSNEKIRLKHIKFWPFLKHGKKMRDQGTYSYALDIFFTDVYWCVHRTWVRNSNAPCGGYYDSGQSRWIKNFMAHKIFLNIWITRHWSMSEYKRLWLMGLINWLDEFFF